MKKIKINGHEFSIGDSVSAEVEWKNGRRTVSTGTLRVVVDDKVYIDTALGTVEVDADTVEPA
jgi:hypothetical protein